MKIICRLVLGLFLCQVCFADVESVLTLGGKELFLRGDRGRQTGIFKDVPVFKANGRKKRVRGKPLKLASGSLVQANIVDAKGRIYKGQEDFVPHPKKLVHIKLLKDENENKVWNKIEGYVYADDLHHEAPRRPLGFYTPDTKKFKGRLSIANATKRIKHCGRKCRKDFSVSKAINEFHNTLCNTIDPKDDDLRSTLIDRWRKYIDKKGHRVKRTTEKAMEHDLVARTILYEAHPPGVLDQRERGLTSCEWDLIGLSILNRGRKCRSYMKCNLLKESKNASAATAHNQYHIWRQENVRNTYMTSCFLRDDLDDKKKKYTNLEGESVINYERVRKAFPQILARVEKIFDAPKSTKNMKKWRQHVTRFFDLNYVDEKKMPKNWITRKANHLLDYTHYYHRGGLLSCRVENYYRTRYIDSAYIKIKPSDQPEQWGLLISERVDFGDRRDKKSTEYEIFFPNELDRGRLTYVPGQTALGATVYLDKRITYRDKNILYTCLPEGKLPRCHDKDSLKAPIYGKRVPTTWFNPRVKKEVAKMYNKLKINLGLHWHKRRHSQGKALAVTCKNPEYKKPPSFEGLCDPYFMPVSGAD